MLLIPGKKLSVGCSRL